MTHDHGKSDRRKVPAKFANKGGAMSSAERDGGKASNQGKQGKQNTSRTQQADKDVQSALDRVRKVAKSDKKMQFTNLMHHISNIDRLRTSYFAMKKTAAAGIDGETWKSYGENLETNLQDLSERLHRGGYRARPVRRVCIAKADGKQRPLGVPVLEDKIVQRSTVEVMNAIYETDFLDLSYGYRPGKGQHNCLDALYMGLFSRVSWVLDADIREFFDNLNHEWLIRFVEHRIGDKRLIRLIQKWLKAGVMIEGRLTETEEGVPQGGSISPLLVLEFGRFAANSRKKRGLGKPETFNFLGFTHICGQTRRNGKFTVLRQTIKKKVRAKLHDVKLELRTRMHHPVPEQGKWLRSVVGGHFRYYGVPTNQRAMCGFRFQVGWLWYRALKRRSQKSKLTWARMQHHVDRWLPHVQILHPYPLQRLRV